MGQCTSTNGDDMVGPAGVACTRVPTALPTKPADGQRRSTSSSQRRAATGVEHHPASRNALAATGKGDGAAAVTGAGGVQRAASSLSSEANSKHVQRLLASLSLLQALPALYPWYIAQPTLSPQLLSICQGRWQSIRLGGHELYATVRAADPASTPTLVFFELFSQDLLHRCPELHIHLFGSAPLTPRTKPSLSAKLCSLVQTTIASFAFASSNPHRHRHSRNPKRPGQLTSFDSVSECSELEPSTSGNANAYAVEPPQAASAAERKQRMQSLWRQFNAAGINCEALGPFFTSLQSALAQCFGLNEWRGNTQTAWNTLCSTVIEQLIGVESTGAGAQTTGAPAGANPQGTTGPLAGASNYLTVTGAMDKSEGSVAGVSMMSSPRSHTTSQLSQGMGNGDTTDTVSRTTAHHHKQPSHNGLPLKPAAYKQRLDLQSTASRVSRSGYTSDCVSPRSAAKGLSTSQYQPSQQSLQPMAMSQEKLQMVAAQAAAHQFSMATSPFSQSGAVPSRSASATPVRRMPSALAQAASNANANAGANATAGHASVQSMSLGLSPLIQLPGQTPSPTTPAAAVGANSRQGSRQVTSDDLDREDREQPLCDCNGPDCKRCEAQADAEAEADDEAIVGGGAQEPMDAETLRAIRETAALDPAQELARFAFHPKPPAKPKVVYMSGLELPPALLAADPATAALIAAADRRAAVYGRSLFGLSRSHPTPQAFANAFDATALALLSNPVAQQHWVAAKHAHAHAHAHNHHLSRNHSHAHTHAPSRSHGSSSNSRALAAPSSAAPIAAPAPLAAPTASTNVHIPLPSDLSTAPTAAPATLTSSTSFVPPTAAAPGSATSLSSNLSLVSRAAASANPNSGHALPVVSVSA